jgi:hypothetical protein
MTRHETHSSNPDVPKCVSPWAKHVWLSFAADLYPLEFCPHCGIFVWHTLDNQRELIGRLLRRHAVGAQFWSEK